MHERFPVRLDFFRNKTRILYMIGQMYTLEKNKPIEPQVLDCIRKAKNKLEFDPDVIILSPGMAEINLKIVGFDIRTQNMGIFGCWIGKYDKDKQNETEN